MEFLVTEMTDGFMIETIPGRDGIWRTYFKKEDGWNRRMVEEAVEKLCYSN